MPFDNLGGKSSQFKRTGSGKARDASPDNQYSHHHTSLVE
jgi:hypothetical protein